MGKSEITPDRQAGIIFLMCVHYCLTPRRLSPPL
jgi:hypothetical protein